MVDGHITNVVEVCRVVVILTVLASSLTVLVLAGAGTLLLTTSDRVLLLGGPSALPGSANNRDSLLSDLHLIEVGCQVLDLYRGLMRGLHWLRAGRALLTCGRLGCLGLLVCRFYILL